MTIKLTSNFTHESVATTQSQSDAEIKSQLTKVLQSINGINESNISWTDDNELELKETSPAVLHTFLLKAEELGKKIEFKKQTIITIK